MTAGLNTFDVWFAVDKTSSRQVIFGKTYFCLPLSELATMCAAQGLVRGVGPGTGTGV